jgi:hypothetical protein
VKFQFPHKKCMEHFSKRRWMFKSTSVLMTLAHLEKIR